MNKLPDLRSPMLTAKDVFKLALAKARYFLAVRRLARIERDIQVCDAASIEWLAAKAHLQREAMFLRADMARMK